jgi:hypothetical protein
MKKILLAFLLLHVAFSHAGSFECKVEKKYSADLSVIQTKQEVDKSNFNIKVQEAQDIRRGDGGECGNPPPISSGITGGDGKQPPNHPSARKQHWPAQEPAHCANKAMLHRSESRNCRNQA